MAIDGRHWFFKHAVNRRACLQAFIQSACNVAEGDVITGTLMGRDGPTIIMAHPPETSSDLSFDEWVAAALTHDHAIKVDLKDPTVIDGVVATLKRHEFPEARLIINADVVMGPGGTPPLVPLGDFIRCRNAFPQAIMSIGSPTGSGLCPYTPDHLDALLSAANVIGEPATLCLRAALLVDDMAIVDRFEQAGRHITIWNDPTTLPATGETFQRIRSVAPNAFIDLSDLSGVPVYVNEPSAML